MMSIEQVLVWSAILTFVMALAGSYYRNRAWDLEGMRRAMGNRDNLPPPTPISGRADRAAMNMLENMVMFTALAAALHFDVSTPNFMIQEAFAEFDVPWRNDLVGGWNPIRSGEFVLSEKPGLGLELDEAAIRAHPYVANSFPSLWDGNWLKNFTQSDS